MTAESPFDSGLQAERTLLAWQRTALFLGAASAVALRLTAPEFGPLAIVVGGASIVLSFAAYIGASERYRRVHASLVRSEQLRTGGLTLAFVSTATVAVAGLALVWGAFR